MSNFWLVQHKQKWSAQYKELALNEGAWPALFLPPSYFLKYGYNDKLKQPFWTNSENNPLKRAEWKIRGGIISEWSCSCPINLGCQHFTWRRGKYTYILFKSLLLSIFCTFIQAFFFSLKKLSLFMPDKSKMHYQNFTKPEP